MPRVENFYMRECIKNNIIIYPVIWKEYVMSYPPKVVIQVNHDGYRRNGEEIHSQKTPEDQKKLYNKIYELYKFYYFRYIKVDS